MEKQITDKQRWAECDTSAGTCYIPLEQLNLQAPPAIANDLDRLEAWREVLGDYLPPCDFHGVEVIEGYGARLSAAGYLDCTEWSVFPTAEEAENYLADEFEDD